MKWDLFVSDIFARIIGIVGLVAAMPWIVYCFTQVKFSGLPVETNFAIGISSFLVILSLLFLLPNVHDKFVRITRPGLLRFLIVIVALAWVIVAVFGLRDQYLLSRMLDAPPLTTYVIAAAAGLLCLGYLLLVAPFGLAWREPRREHALRMEQRAIQAAAEQSRRMYAVQSEAAMQQPAHPGPNAIAWRKTDFLDVLLMLPFMALLIATLYGMKFSRTASLPDWNAFGQSNWIAGSAVVFVVVILPMLLGSIFRAPVRNFMRPDSRPPHPVVRFAVGIPMAIAVYFGAVWYGVPSTAHYVVDTSLATLTYEVERISTSRRSRGCATLVPTNAPDASVSVCNVSGTLVRDLRPGEIIEVTGPLSAYGHTFEQVRIVR
ncbi:hypothetical protein [Gymnodinialimonas hymeniacidonis]|uniref:hypothetical protein n=1 Tax=Gymnodinialimonas hymeniacidonis TaxID=3126508 RepID=UPI0034C5C4DA